MKKNIYNMVGAGFLATMMLAQLANAQAFTTQMQVGASGQQVTALQTLLSQNSSVYPEGRITGYFGVLTKMAVQRLQALYNLPVVGRVGPMTIDLLNRLSTMGWGTTGNDSIAPTISNISVSSGSNSATINFSTNENAMAKVYYSSTPLSMYESETDVTFQNGNVAYTDTNTRTSHSIVLNGLQNGTNYYYVIYTKDANGNVNISNPMNVTFRTN